MRLQKLRLRNFRCFAGLEVTLDQRLTIFVGNNATGKSALVDAIVIGLGPIVERLRKLYASRLEEHDLHRDPQGAPAAFVEIALATVNPGLEWDLELLRDRAASTRGEVQLIRRGAGERPAKRKQLHTYLDNLLQSHRGQQPFDLPVFASYEADRAAKDVAGPKAEVDPYYEWFSAYVKAHRAGISFGEAVAWFDRTQHESLAHPGSAAERALSIVRRAVTRLLPQIEVLEFQPAADRLVARFRSPSGDLVVLPVARLSHGYQGMLAMVMDFARRMATANPHLPDPLAGEGICLIDEVDLHLHPEWQQRVIPSLLEVFPNTQFVLTTHSPQVLTTMPPNHVRRINFEPERPGQPGRHILREPTSTLGAESSRVLQDVMRVNPRPPQDAGPLLEAGVRQTVPEMLRQYLDLVRQGQGRTPEALRLRQELDQLTNREEPALERADAEIRRLELFGR